MQVPKTMPRIPKTRTPVDKNTEKDKKNYLEKIVGLAQSDKNQIERNRLTGNIITLFLAAVDTTSKTLTHALHILAEDQDLQRELRKEVDQMTVNGEKTLDFTTLYDLFTKIPHIKSFMHETHRNYSPMVNKQQLRKSPFLAQHCPREPTSHL